MSKPEYQGIPEHILEDAARPIWGGYDSLEQVMRRIAKPVAIAFDKVGLLPDGTRKPESAELSTDAIKELTGFKLQMVVPGFSEDDGYISPDLHEERERLSAKMGEDNVLPSFFTEDRVLKLGLFVRTQD